MKRSIMIAVLLVGRACGGWLNPSQPGFTADETLLRIAGDRTNAAALTVATNGLWQAMGGHNHDSRYDAAGAANAVNSQLSGVLADETGARAAFDADLLRTNGLVLFGQDLYRQTVVDSVPGWLDWQVAEIVGDTVTYTWAHWDYRGEWAHPYSAGCRPGLCPGRQQLGIFVRTGRDALVVDRIRSFRSAV